MYHGTAPSDYEGKTVGYICRTLQRSQGDGEEDQGGKTHTMQRMKFN
jgi:hypothetical protein